MGMLLIGSAPYLTSVRSGGAYDSFIVHTGYHVLKRSVPIVAFQLGVEWFIPGRQKDHPHFHFHLLRRLIKVYGLIITDAFANTAFPFVKVKTGFRINIADKGIRLRKVDMDGFIRGYVLVKWVRHINRAVICAGSTTSAFFFQNVSRCFNKGYLKIPCFPLYIGNVR